jgi:hypothetical protein
MGEQTARNPSIREPEMFYCPACGGAVATTNNSHYCVVCDWYDQRTIVAVDGDLGLRYPAANHGVNRPGTAAITAFSVA